MGLWNTLCLIYIQIFGEIFVVARRWLLIRDQMCDFFVTNIGNWHLLIVEMRSAQTNCSELLLLYFF